MTLHFLCSVPSRCCCACRGCSVPVSKKRSYTAPSETCPPFGCAVRFGCAHARERAHKRTRAHAHLSTCLPVRWPDRQPTRSHACTCVHMHVRTHACAHTCMYTHMPVRTHACTDTHTGQVSFESVAAVGDEGRSAMAGLASVRWQASLVCDGRPR